MARLRLMTWNLLEGGRGPDGQRLDLIASVLRGARPDVLVACEAHGLLEEPALLADFSAAVGMRAKIAPARSGAHVALFVRPSVGLTHFEAAEVGSQRRALLAALQVPGMGELLVAGAHLDHEDPHARRREMDMVLARLPQRPRAVLGDFNAISHQDGVTRRDLLAMPLHHVSRHVGPDGEPDTTVTQALEAAGLVDAWRMAHEGEPVAAGLTVPTHIPQPPRFAGMRLDYIFVSADVPAALVACDVHRAAPAPKASDHFPVVADLEPHA